MTVLQTLVTQRAELLSAIKTEYDDETRLQLRDDLREVDQLLYDCGCTTSTFRPRNSKLKFLALLVK